MSIDPTTLPACTQEDGSDPGQIFPCHWDASLMGNGTGDSFVMTDQTTVIYDDAAVQAQHEAPAVSPANEEPAALTLPEPVATTQAQVLATPPAPELAHTGPTDPIMWVAAALMVSIGIVCKRVARSS